MNDPITLPRPWFPRLVSLLIAGHLFLVVAAMTASYGRSETTGWLLSRCAFYTQTLDLDLNLNFARLHLTHATQVDVDHRLEVLPGENDPDDPAGWAVIRRGAFHGSERYRRYQRWARCLALLVDAGDLSGAARMSRDAAEHFLRTESKAPSQVRVRRHLLQDWEALSEGTPEERDPDHELYFRTPYVANCVVSSDGRVEIVRLEDPNQVAYPGLSTE